MREGGWRFGGHGAIVLALFVSLAVYVCVYIYREKGLESSILGYTTRLRRDILATSGSLFKMDSNVSHDHINGYLRNQDATLYNVTACSVNLVGVVTSVVSNQIVHEIFADFLAAYKRAELVIVLDDGYGKDIFSQQLANDSRVHILDINDQHELFPQLSNVLPMKSFSRKNLGYLHAISLGACYIWDFDDDNDGSTLRLLHHIDNLTGDTMESQDILPVLGCLSSSFEAVNPYLLFGPHQYVWPRGYPIELTKTKDFPILNVSDACGVNNVDIIQVLQKLDPDVDAIWRLQNNLPLDWLVSRLLQDGIVAIDPSKFAPYNAQSTIVSRKAFWSLYLPFTVHGRVSDIWRSFLMQAVGRHTGNSIGFLRPNVSHYRNSHNYLGDFEAEEPLYEQSGELIKYLSSKLTDLLPSEGDALDALIAVYAAVGINDLFKNQFEEEMRGLIFWVNELRKIYQVPQLHLKDRENVGLEGGSQQIEQFRRETNEVLNVVHINHKYTSNIPILAAINPEYAHQVYFTPGVAECIQIAGLDVNCISDDQPGLYAYESIFHAYKHNPKYSYYIFTHDDAVIRLKSLRNFLVQGMSLVADGKNHPLFYTANHNFFDDWYWNGHLNKSLGILGNDWKPTCSMGAMGTSWRRGQADFFFATNEAMQILLEDSQKLRWADTFLENAVHTLFLNCISNLRNYSLFTDWGHLRSDPRELVNAFCNSQNDVVHPVKLSSKIGLESYIRAKVC